MITTQQLEVTPEVSLQVSHLGNGDGPRVCILGGVHGDELEGVLSAQRLITELSDLPLRGTVSVLPKSNPPALSVGTRVGADDDNLARLFPGSGDGRLSERLAHTIATELIEPCDLLIDLHSAGRRYRMPAMCGFGGGTTLGTRSMLDVVRKTSFPMLWMHPSVGPGRSVSHADHLGKPWVYFESGGSGALQQSHLDLYVGAVHRLLFEIGIHASPAQGGGRHTDQVVVTDGNGDIDAGITCGSDGIFVAAVDTGERVRPGQTVGTVFDAEGAVRSIVTSPVQGIVMMLRHELSVKADDVAAVIAAEHATP